MATTSFRQVVDREVASLSAVAANAISAQDAALPPAGLYLAQRTRVRDGTLGAPLSELKKQLDAARRHRVLLQQRRLHADNQSDARSSHQGSVDSGDVNPVARARRVVLERAALMRELCLRKEAFAVAVQAIEAGGANALRGAQVTSALDYAADFAVFADEAAAKLRDLELDAQVLRASVEVPSTAVEELVLEECWTMYRAHGATLLREATRRRDYDAAVRAFTADHGRLMQWCRKQLAQLSGLTRPEQVQEFCASFRATTAHMGGNLLVLLESSAALIPNAEVQRALLDVSETWLGLETYAYDRLRTTLLEQHAQSGLDAVARAWPQYAARLHQFLQDARRVLEGSGSSTAVLPLRQACVALLQEADAHQLIVDHVADFALREECVADHFRSVRAALFSRFALLCQTFALATHPFPRRAEYQDCAAELGAWVDAKSQGAAWRDMLHRVDAIRALVEATNAAANEGTSKTDL